MNLFEPTFGGSRNTYLLKLIQESLDLMLQIEPSIPDQPYEYIGALSKPHHAAVFYTMRPNPYYAKTLPCSDNTYLDKHLFDHDQQQR
jgi:hypothetical protein